MTLGKYALCRVPDGRHSAKCSLCRVFVGHSAKSVPFFLNVCRVPLRPALGKVVILFFLNTMECGLGFRFKKKEKIFVECPDLALGKPATLVLCRVSGSGTRQTWTTGDGRYLTPFLPSARVCQVPDTRQKGPLPSVWLCRAAKPSLPSVYRC